MMYVEMGASGDECRAAAFCDLICKRVQARRPTRNDLDILRSVVEGDGLREHQLLGHLNNLERALRKRRWTDLHQEEFSFLVSMVTNDRSIPEVFEMALAMSVNEGQFEIDTVMTIRPKSASKGALGVCQPITVAHGGQFDSRFGGMTASDTSA